MKSVRSVEDGIFIKLLFKIPLPPPYLTAFVSGWAPVLVLDSDDVIFSYMSEENKMVWYRSLWQ